MADLFQFICENSDHSQILPVLKRFVERKDFVVDTNFLESLKLVLNALEKSKNFGEDLAATVLFEICWPMVYSSSLAKDNNQLSGHNRKRLHLCYEIIAFCCSVFPKTLLSEVCEKSLHILRRYVVEMSATEDNAKDVSITLDLVGYLVKPHALSPSERNNTISGELGDMLFQELLNILPFTTESLCGKATGLVLPNFLEFKRVERCEVSCTLLLESKNYKFHRFLTREVMEFNCGSLLIESHGEFIFLMQIFNYCNVVFLYIVHVHMVKLYLA